VEYSFQGPAAHTPVGEGQPR